MLKLPGGPLGYGNHLAGGTLVGECVSPTLDAGWQTALFHQRRRRWRAQHCRSDRHARDAFTQAIHNRMPVLLDRPDLEAWLNGAARTELLRPAVEDHIHRETADMVNPCAAPDGANTTAPFRMAAPYYLSQRGQGVKPKAWLADPFLENVRFSF
jgi:hypothetical protein